jgi:hypothetical protein
LSSPGSGWPILAAASTSCPFAGNILSAYVDGGEMRLWRGQVGSPVTHKRYRITCRRTGPANFVYEKVTCTEINGIWTRFPALYN